MGKTEGRDASKYLRFRTEGRMDKEKIKQAYAEMILGKIEEAKMLPADSIRVELLKALQDAVELISHDFQRNFLS